LRSRPPLLCEEGNGHTSS